MSLTCPLSFSLMNDKCTSVTVKHRYNLRNMRLFYFYTTLIYSFQTEINNLSDFVLTTLKALRHMISETNS